MRITHRVKSLDGHELRPGDVFRVARLDTGRYVQFADGRRVAYDFGHLEEFVACTPTTLPRRVDYAVVTAGALPAFSVEALRKLARREILFAGCDEPTLVNHFSRTLPAHVRRTRWDPVPTRVQPEQPGADPASAQTRPAPRPGLAIAGSAERMLQEHASPKAQHPESQAPTEHER